MNMNMNTRIDGDLLVIELIGEITFFNVGQVISEIDRSRSVYQVQRVAINAEAVTMIDSAAFGALVGKARELNEEEGYMRISNAHQGIVNALHRIHMQEVLPTYKSLEEAIRPW